MSIDFSNEKENSMKIIQTVAFKLAAMTTTKFDSPEPEATTTQSPALPQ